MKNIFKVYICVLSIALLASCSKTYKVEKADASFTAYKLDVDKARVTEATDNLTVNLFQKTIDGVDQKVAFVEFEFTGSGDLVCIWTGDSCSVHVPKKIDGLTGDTLEWQDLKFASNYDLYKENDFTQKGTLLTDGKLIYTYWKAGTYKATLIATNWGEMDSGEMNRDEKSITITVVE